MDWGDLWSGGDTAFGTDTFSGGGWSQDLFTGGNTDWLGSIGDIGGDSGGSWWSGLFGGGGGSGGSGGSSGTGDIFKMILGGLGSYADSNVQRGMTKEQIQLAGLESRKNTSFAADLKDYYDQKDKRNKRIALDTYGQFSDLKSRMPNYVEPPVPTLGARPTP